MDFIANGITALDGVSRLTIASILVPTVLAFIIGVWLAPLTIKYLVRLQLWRKSQAVVDISGKAATVTQKLNQRENRQVPRMGGLVIVVTAVLTLAATWLVSLGQPPGSFWAEINLVTRSETWLPIFALLTGFALGFLDDLIVLGRVKFKLRRLRQYIRGGLPLTIRILVVALIGLACGLWFFLKLGVTAVDVPFVASDLQLGFFIVPLIMVAMVATYSGGVIDGVDGLAGSVFATIFITYATIALLQGLLDLAAFCLVVVGGTFSFLWYNIRPASFYMSETGVLALTLALSMVAFMTDTVFLLPLIAAPLYWTALSNVIQVISKKLRNRKVFVAAPVHNHFRAIGVPDDRLVMRYWVISQVLSISALAVFLVGY